MEAGNAVFQEVHSLFFILSLFPTFFFLPALSFAKKGDRLVVLLSVLVPKVFKVLLVLEVPKSGTSRTTRWGICVSVSCF